MKEEKIKQIMEFKFGEKFYIRTPIEDFKQFVKMMSYIQKSIKEHFEEERAKKSNNMRSKI